jgi:hypothetical protein
MGLPEPTFLHLWVPLRRPRATKDAAKGRMKLRSIL